MVGTEGQKLIGLMGGYAESAVSQYGTVLEFGKVLSVAPLRIQLGENEIDEELIVVSNSLSRQSSPVSLNIDGKTYKTEVVFDNSLKIGDDVSLIVSKLNGLYFILSKL